MGVTVRSGAEAGAIPAQVASGNEFAALATVAHELRGPLAALITSSELLAEDFEHLDARQVTAMLGGLHRRALWLQGLVDNLLCAASIRGGRLQLHRQPICFDDLLAEVDSVVGPMLAQHSQTLRVHVATGLPEVVADSRRVSQVLVNLILNASKFGPPATQIDVSLARGADGGVRVAVADRGPGVAAEQAERLFEPYYQVPALAGGRQEGIGLGLSIVKSVVEAHGGRVGVENRRGGGARFWFSLPSAATGGAGSGRVLKLVHASAMEADS